ncbi:MAG TPA: DUF1707 domain-containing protein [Solirubrobacteraceae bacterium]|jgi:hypothetical protein|nr:DUF1707 domain-containing protein [Solirubrobacteraceae bacterium]
MSDESLVPRPSDQRPDLRASDADREQTAERLRRAMGEGRLSVEELEDRLRVAYSAPTVRELELLVSDVTPAAAPSGGRRAVASARSSGLTVREGPGGDRWVVAIMSGHERRGRWRIARRCTVLNIMGGSDIDLNDAELADPVTELNVYTVMGGAEIRVPEGVDVEVSNVAVMGANDVKLGDQDVPAGSPVIRVRLVSIMGGVAVKRGRKPSKEERRRQKELRTGGTGLLVENELVDAEREEQRQQAPGDRPAQRAHERDVEPPEAQDVHEDPCQHDRVTDDRGQG